jgi:hypothetical protein
MNRQLSGMPEVLHMLYCRRRGMQHCLQIFSLQSTIDFTGVYSLGRLIPNLHSFPAFAGEDFLKLTSSIPFSRIYSPQPKLQPGQMVE